MTNPEADAALAPPLKATNPKDAIGDTKLPLHLVPDTLPAYASMAFAEGDAKYGGYNWRVAGVRLSVYVAAARRHEAKFWNGEWEDPATGIPHISSILACYGIIADAHECGKLTDDRPPVAPMGRIIADAEKRVGWVRKVFEAFSPKRWTIKD